MQVKTSWMRVALAGAALLATGLLVACSDDDGSESGATGGNSVAGEATATPTAADEGVNTPGTTGGTGPLGATGGESPAPPGFPTSDEPPVTTASANGESVETGIGTYCWTRMCVDKIGVPTVGTLVVSPGDVVSIAIPEDAPPLREAAANVFEAVEAEELDDGSEIWPYPSSPGDEIAYEVTQDSVNVSVDLEPGKYVLAVSMFFEVGDVVYGVLLEVE